MLANTWEIARNTVEDSIRRRVLGVFLVLAILTLGLAVAVQYNATSSRAELYTPGQMLIILIFGALIAITTSVFLIPTEIERRTIYSVLSKPVQRWEFFLGKFLGGSLAAGLMVGIMAVVLIVSIIIFASLPPANVASAATAPVPWGKAVVGQIIPVLVGSVLVFIQLMAVTAIATFLSLFLTATVNFSVTAFLWILGSLQWIVLALSNRQDQGLVLVPWLLKGAYYLTPHFYDINVIGGLVRPEVAIRTTIPIYASTVGLYTVLYIAIVLFAGIIAFEKKEM